MLEIPNETIQDEEISVATTPTAQLVTRKRGCAKDYLAVQNFPSFEDAINFVKEEKNLVSNETNANNSLL